MSLAILIYNSVPYKEIQNRIEIEKKFHNNLKQYEKNINRRRRQKNEADTKEQ